MIVRPLPLLLFGPLAVWWMILHWRAVRRVEVARSVEAYRSVAAAAMRARDAFVEMTVALIHVGQMTVSALRMSEDLRVVLGLASDTLHRPPSQTLRDAGIPSTFDPDRIVVDVSTDRL